MRVRLSEACVHALYHSSVINASTRPAQDSYPVIARQIVSGDEQTGVAHL
jgi:hypothetical protein